MQVRVHGAKSLEKEMRGATDSFADVAAIASSLFLDGELGGDQVYGISADHDRERAGFHDAVHISIQEREFIGPQRELCRFCFARVQRDTAESAKFLNGARDRAYFVADVELHHFIAANCAGIDDVNGDGGAALGTDGIRGRSEIRILEGGIAESPAEGKEREDGAAEIFALRGWLLIVVVG